MCNYAGHDNSTCPTGHDNSTCPTGHDNSTCPTRHDNSTCPNGHDNSTCPTGHDNSTCPTVQTSVFLCRTSGNFGICKEVFLVSQLSIKCRTSGDCESFRALVYKHTKKHLQSTSFHTSGCHRYSGGAKQILLSFENTNKVRCPSSKRLSIFH